MNALPTQQYKCLYHLTQGMSYKEIGREMNLSPRTVEYYMGIIREKTGNKSRRALVQFFNINYSQQFRQG